VPHFYFHLFNDADFPDDEGADLPDAAAARVHAVGEAREMICAEVQKGHLNLDHRIEIEDEQGGRTSVTFRDAFTLIG
jgi:hypothetical protein